MKLKEKLAREYSDEPNSIDEFNTAQKLLMRTAYIAGFEKARELALSLIREIDDLGEPEIE